MSKIHKQPTVELVTITPEMATVILKRSRRKNVPMKERKIAQYAEDMVHDRWDPYNSQMISIDENEDINNGHQRLTACVRAGVPFRTFLMRGAPPESFTTEDTGRSRDSGHYFAMLGEKNYFHLAAGARALYFWERGMWHAGAVGGGPHYVSNEELKDELARRPILRDGAAFASNHQPEMKGRFTAGPVVALFTLTRGHPRHAAFWTELVERAGGTKTSAAWQLNHRIDMAKSRKSRIIGGALLALLTKAWNIYASGEDKGLTWDGKKERKFPVPVTDLTPALLPPEPVKNEPKLDGKVGREGKPGKPTNARPSANGVHGKRKKGPKLRGGLNSAAV